MSNDKEYELIQDDILVAGTSGPGAWKEMQHYAAMYGQDAPVEIYEVTRVKVYPVDQEASPANGAVGEMPIGWIKPRFLESLSNYREAARNPSNFSVAVQAGQHDAEDKPLYTVEQLRAAVLAERAACAETALNHSFGSAIATAIRARK